MDVTDRRSRRSPGSTVIVAIVAGAVLLVVSVAFAMRWPNALLRSAPADAARFDHSPSSGAPLGPLSDEYVAARSAPRPKDVLRPSIAQEPSVAPAAVPAKPSHEKKVSYPRAAACSVNNDGLLPGESRSCRFTATESGGWAKEYWGPQAGSDPDIAVTVMRGRASDTYWGFDVIRACENNIIEPGDRVEVEMTFEENDTGDVGVGTVIAGAGGGWDCSHRQDEGRLGP